MFLSDKKHLLPEPLCFFFGMGRFRRIAEDFVVQLSDGVFHVLDNVVPGILFKTQDAFGLGRHIENDAKEDEVGKRGRSAVGNERKRDTGDRNKPDDHPQILDLLVQQHGNGTDHDKAVER